MENPILLPTIRNIAISGRIGSGSSTLAKRLANVLHWKLLNGGDLFRQFTKDHGFAEGRSDQFDLDYEARVAKILHDEEHHIIESHLAGFDAQGIDGVFKILVVCEDEDGDKTDIRIDRLVNRDQTTVESAKHEVFERERQNLEKWRRLYAKGDNDWVYWKREYFDFVINTYSHNPEQSLALVLEKMGYKE